MKQYKEFQFSWWMLFLAAIHISIAISYIYQLGERPVTTNAFIVQNTILISIYILFYGLTTTVNADEIKAAFGIGLVRRRIPLSRIKSVETVRNFWYSGWGIRLISGAIMFNTWGLEAVEIKFHDTNRVFRIGSRDANRLKEEIEKRRR